MTHQQFDADSGSFVSRVIVNRGRHEGANADHDERIADRHIGDGEILDSDPPRRLSYTWRALYDEETAAEEPSRVTWEIETQDGGVSKLTVVHDQLERAPKTAENVAGGWMYILSGMKTLLETGESLTS